MFQDCECCGTGIAIGYRVETVTLKLRADGTTVLPWELRTMSESQKILLKTENRQVRQPVAYPDRPCPHCPAGKRRAVTLLGKEVKDPEDELAKKRERGRFKADGSDRC